MLRIWDELCLTFAFQCADLYLSLFRKDEYRCLVCSATIDDILTQFSIDSSLPEFGGPKEQLRKSGHKMSFELAAELK